MFNEDKEIIIKKDIVLREEDDGAFLFDPGTGRICYLNDTGVEVWRLCARPITKDQLVGRLCSEYSDQSREKITEDCDMFLKGLHDFGFMSA
ncbi:MAG: PqqD family protein [Deltaproteobacteria bacterium]|nr:PqqD family protein [Deltaproteobacteria bacterium]